MPLDNAGDLLFQLPRPGEPESALIGGMAAPNPLVTVPDTSGPMPPTPQQEPGSWTYDFNSGGVARATFNGEVAFTSGGSATAGVTTWNGRTGAVVLTAGDVTAAGGAPLASPAFTGIPAAPTASPGTSTTQLATTGFVQQELAAQIDVNTFNGRSGDVVLTASDITTAGGAPAASPAFTGTPTGPTAIQGTATGQLATTQFVANAIGQAVVSWNGRTGAVSLSLSDVQSVGGAPVASPTFTGTPAGPTAAPGTSTTQLASTAFVTNAVAAATAGVSSFNTRTGAVTLQAADVTNVGGALLLSPTFTGTPAAPTVTAGDSSTKIATTAFVATAIGAMAPVVASFNARTGAVTLQAADVTGVGGALLASPVFTGTPAAPTPTAGDNSTRIATTAFVATSFLTTATAASTYAPLASPTFTGDPKAPTPATADNDTSIATTAFVKAQNYVPIAGNVTMTGNLTVTTTVEATGTYRLNGQQFATSTGGAGTENVIYDRNGGNAILCGTSAVSIPDHDLSLAKIAGGYAVITHTVTGQRTWTQGEWPDGTWTLYDNGASATRLFIDVGGNCKNTTGTWAALSDAELKTAVADYPRGLADLTRLQPRSFRYTGPYDDGQLHQGFVAQEMEPHFPELVGTMDIAGPVQDAEGKTLPHVPHIVKTVDPTATIYAVVNALKEIAGRLDLIESKLATLP